MEASKVLKKDDERPCDNMHECHQEKRIMKLEDAVHDMAIQMAKVATNTQWIKVMNIGMAVTIFGGAVTLIVHFMVK